MKSLNLILTGNIPSNKNSLLARLSNALITHLRTIPQKDIHNKSKSKYILKALVKFIRIKHTTTYSNWVIEAKKQIISQIDYEPFFDKVHVEYEIFFGKKGIAGGDTENKISSIADLLVDCGILDDDNYGVIEFFTARGTYRKGNPGAEIKITVLNK